MQKFYRYYPVATRDREWGIFVTTVGETRIAQGSSYPPEGHPKDHAFRASAGRRLNEFHLVYISAGKGWFNSAVTGKVAVEAGTVLFLFPGVWHSYAPQPSTGWTEHWVGFDGDMVRRMLRRGFFSATEPMMRARREDDLLALLRELTEAAQSNFPALQQIMGACTLRILALLYSAQQSEPGGEERAAQIIHKAIARLRDGGPARIDFNAVAHDLGVSYSWFRQAFRHHTGLSPHQYCLDLRLAKARGLLANTSLTTKEIAQQVGFEDGQYFCRLFHKKVGFTPGDWRERAQNSG